MRFILAFLLSFSALAGEWSLQVRGSEAATPTITLHGYGRGVAVAKDLVLTARHVVMDGMETKFRTPEVLINGTWIAGEIAGHDSKNDLLLIRMPKGTKLKPIGILSIPDLYTEGSPGVEKPEKRRTRINALMLDVEEVGDLSSPHDAGGISGSPLHEGDNLIGIISAATMKNGRVFVIAVGPEPIKQLLANHLKEDTKE